MTALLIQSTKELKAQADEAKVRADKAEAATANLKTDSKAKDAAIARLQAESVQLKAFLCGQFPNALMCQP